MGMFDEITCEYPLPDKEAQNAVFQTKDLNNLLETYVITKHGRLVLHQWRYEETPKEELPYPDAKPGELQRLFGTIRRVEGSESLEDQDYHGDIYMYCGGYEYTVRFTEGTVSRITREKYMREEAKSGYSEL